MTITSAVYQDINETTISALVDGVQATIPKDPGNRHYRQILFGTFDEEGVQIELPVTVTPFLDVPGRLDEAKTIAEGKVRGASDAAAVLVSVSAGGWDFKVTSSVLLYVSANLAEGSSSLDLEDDTGSIRTLTSTDQQTLIQNYKSSRTAIINDRVTEVSAINAVTDPGGVATLDGLLAGSAFGDLSPVYEPI